MDTRVRTLAVVVLVLAAAAFFGSRYFDLTSSPISTEAAATPAERADAQRLAAMRTLATAIARYYDDNKSYPETPAGTHCQANYNNVGNLSSSLIPKYTSSIPQDPNPRSCEYNYTYQATADRENYVLMVNLAGTDSSIYSDHWCIGASSGTVPDYTGKYLPCPAVVFSGSQHRDAQSSPSGSESTTASPVEKADSQRLAAMRSLAAAIDRYHDDSKSYPDTPAGDRCQGQYNNTGNLSPVLVPKYILSIPQDPNPRSCEYNYLYQATSDRKNYVLMVNLTDIEPAIYSDHWCIGASSGSVPDYTGKYLPCPPRRD